MIKEKISIVGAIHEQECIRWERSECFAAINNAYNYAPRILGYPSRQATILTCSGPLKSPALAIWTFLSPSSDVNEPSIYSRTSLKQYCWDRGVSIVFERLLN